MIPTCPNQRGVIAQWTTPSITYKPSKVQMEDVDEIYLTISQTGDEIIQLDKGAASVTEEGFIWLLSQEQTSALSTAKSALIQVDYKTTAGLRYTTMPKSVEVLNSAVKEVI